MHFWIGERASQYQHQGRRRRPLGMYTGSFFGLGSGLPNRRGDKPFGWNRRFSSQIPPQLQHHHPPPHHQQPSTSHASSSTNSTVTPPPPHRFVNPVTSLDPRAPALAPNFTARHSAPPGDGTLGGGDASPNSRHTNQNSNNACRYSRSRSREHRSSDPTESQRRRRSSTSRRYRNSNGLASSEAGVVGSASSTNSEVRENSFDSSESGIPDCSRTKHVGITLCFMGFILLCTVAAKVVIEGPGLIDTSRRGQTETTAYFFLTELIFVAFALALFFTGVACLRKRTNDYLLRQFNQHILRGSNQRGMADDLSNSELLYDPIIIAPDQSEQGERNAVRASYPHPSHGLSAISTSMHHNCMNRHSPSHHSSSFYHQHHHHHHHMNHYGAMLTPGHASRHGHHHYALSGTSGRRCPYLTSSAAASAAIMLQRQQPPPYHIALYLPLPSGTGQGQVADQCEIIDEQQVAIEGSGVVIKEEGSESTGENESDLEVKDSDESKEEMEIDLELPETPPPSYDQFVLRL